MEPKPKIKCPGYERKGFFNRKCRFIWNGVCMLFAQNNIDPDAYDFNCPTGGRKPN